MMRIVAILFLACGSLAGRPPGFSALGTRVPASARALRPPPGWKDVTPGAEPIAAPTLEARSGGYIFFSRNPMTRPEVFHAPYLFEVSRAVITFIALGEYEPVEFCLRPLEDLEDAMLHVEELRGPENARISLENIDVRQLWIYRKAVDRAQKTYRRVPLILEKAHPTWMPRGVTRHYWITIHVPRETIPGVYRGHVTFKAKNRPSTSRELVVRVLPFALEPPGINYGIFYGLHASWLRVYGKQEVFPGNRTKHLVDQREHGMQHVTIRARMGLRLVGEGKETVAKLDPNAAAEWLVSLREDLRSAREAGFYKQPCIWIGDANVEELAQSLLRFCRANGRSYDASTCAPGSWLFDRVYESVLTRGAALFQEEGMKKPYCFVVDEAGNSEERRRICDRYLLVAKRLGFSTILTINGQWNNMHLPTRFKGYLDIAVHNDIIGAFVLEKDSAAGVGQVWIYNMASRTDPHETRMRMGWYILRIGASGATQWVYQWPKKENMYDDLTTNPRGAGEAFAYPSAEGPLPTVGWEAYREAVDVVRYVRTLQKLCREKEKTNPAAVAPARKELRQIIDRFDIDRRRPVKVVSPDTAQKWRGRIAWHILSLLK